VSIHKRITQRRTVYDSRLRDPEGKERWRTFATKREAVDFEAQERNARNRGMWVDHRRAKGLFADVAAEWLRSNPAKRPSAMVRDEGIIRVHLLPPIGGRAVGAITPDDVQGLVNAWSREARPRTVRRQYGVLRAILTMAVERDYIGRTPCRSIRLPRVEAKVRVIVTPDQLDDLADAAGAYRSMVYVGAVLGLRWGEAAALRVRDIDFCAAISRSRTRCRAEPRERSTKAHRSRTSAVARWPCRRRSSQCWPTTWPSTAVPGRSSMRGCSRVRRVAISLTATSVGACGSRHAGRSGSRGSGFMTFGRRPRLEWWPLVSTSRRRR